MSELDFSKIDPDSLKSSSNASSQDSVVIAREDITPSAGMLAVGVIVIGIAILLMVYLAKKFRIIERIRENMKFLMGCLSGWGIWFFLVFSYGQLFDAYLDYSLWLTLPPLSFMLVIAWYRYFLASK